MGITQYAQLRLSISTDFIYFVLSIIVGGTLINYYYYYYYFIIIVIERLKFKSIFYYNIYVMATL